MGLMNSSRMRTNIKSTTWRMLNITVTLVCFIARWKQRDNYSTVLFKNKTENTIAMHYECNKEVLDEITLLHYIITFLKKDFKHLSWYSEWYRASELFLQLFVWQVSVLDTLAPTDTTGNEQPGLTKRRTRHFPRDREILRPVYIGDSQPPTRRRLSQNIDVAIFW